MVTCQFCQAILSSSASLKHHQKTARYCLKKQGKKSDKYECKSCESTFTTKRKMLNHQQSCLLYMSNQMNIKHNNELTKKDTYIYELKKQIRELQDKLENIAIKAASRSTNTTHINNYIQKLELTTDEYFKEKVSQLTIEHIKKGPKGYAEYALEYPLNNRLVCVDYSRRKVKYKNKEGKIITDPEMTKLAKKLFESINSRNKELIMEFLQDTSGTLDPVVQMEMMTDMGDYIAMVNRGAAGEKTDLYHDFIKNVCSQSVV